MIIAKTKRRSSLTLKLQKGGDLGEDASPEFFFYVPFPFPFAKKMHGRRARLCEVPSIHQDFESRRHVFAESLQYSIVQTEAESFWLIRKAF
jgi:hypothetical protein